jgi:hypothetical protein
LKVCFKKDGLCSQQAKARRTSPTLAFGVHSGICGPCLKERGRQPCGTDSQMLAKGLQVILYFLKSNICFQKKKKLTLGSPSRDHCEHFDPDPTTPTTFSFFFFFFALLGIEPRDSQILGKHSTTVLHPHPLFASFN